MSHKPGHEKISGEGLLLLGAFCISYSPIFVHLADILPGVAGFYRTSIGGSMLLVYLILRRSRNRADVSRSSLLKGLRRGRPSRQALWLVLACGLLFAVDLTFWHRSIRYVGPGLATLLGNFQVFFLALFGVLFFREKLSVRFASAIVLALAGVAMIVGFSPDRPEAGTTLGLVFGLLTAVVYAAFILVLKQSQSIEKALDPMTNMCALSFVTAIILGLQEWAVGSSFGLPNTKSLLAMIGYGLFGQLLGWVFISRGLPKVRSSLAGLLLLLQPVLSYVWEVLFFSKRIGWRETSGALLALAAIHLGTMAQKSKR